MMIKNQEKTGIVAGIGMNGEGIVKDGNQTVFVPFALPGEKIVYRLVKCSSKGNFGKIIEILTPADERVRPLCPVYMKCGGCQLQHLKYSYQLKLKQDKVKTCFKKIAGLDLTVKNCIKNSNEYRYRNKLQLPVGESDFGTVVGFYAGNSHRIVPIEDCNINSAWTATIISCLKAYMKKNKLKGYNEQDFSGDIREITVKDVSGSLIITLVTIKESLPNLEQFIDLIQESLPNPFSLYLNVNDGKNNVIYSDRFIKVYGNERFEASMLGVKYSVGVQSFTQVNNDVCEKLYFSVKKLAELDENTVLIDAYSGAGLLTAILASGAKKAYGIEIVKEAVELADKLAKENGLDHKMTNIVGECENVLPDIVREEVQKGEKVTVVLDPPRKGCDVKVLNALISSNIDKIIYISCNPATLARDVGLMVGSLEIVGNEIKKAQEYTPKYNVAHLQPFDMFSQTKHVETVCMLEKIK